jgi:hypothetical protein
LSGGVKYGPPPKKGPNPQGIKLNRAKKLLRQAIKKNKIIWLSGLFDGEGSFGIWSKGVGKKTFSATIEMGDEDIIKRFQDMFGGAVWKTKKKQERFRQLWRWRCVGDRAYDCIDKMIEYMGTRRQEKYHVVKSDISSR